MSEIRRAFGAEHVLDPEIMPVKKSKYVKKPKRPKRPPYKKADFKLRPYRVLFNEKKKKHFKKERGKPIYISNPDNLSDKQLVKVVINNHLGYKPRKRKDKPKLPKTITKPLKEAVSAQPMYHASTSPLVFSRPIYPSMVPYPQEDKTDYSKIQRLIEDSPVHKIYLSMLKYLPEVQHVDNKDGHEPEIIELDDIPAERLSEIKGSKPPVVEEVKTPVEQTTESRSPSSHTRNLFERLTRSQSRTQPIVRGSSVGRNPTLEYKPKYNLDNISLNRLRLLYQLIDKNFKNEYPIKKANLKKDSEVRIRKYINESGFVNSFSPKEFDRIIEEDLKGHGAKGDDSDSEDDGLYGSEIQDDIKELTGRYVPVVASDRIKELAKMVNKDTQTFSFVYNTSKHNQPGQHWISVFISRPECSVERFDPLVSQIPKSFLKQIQPIIKAMHDECYFKIKNNMAKSQASDSSNCGWFAIDFLTKRISNVPYKNASFFHKINNEEKGEKEIEKFKSFI